MAVFFDTSALVRRYDLSEPGAQRVREICRNTSDKVLFIAALTPLEVASALNRQLREGRVGILERDRRWSVFRSHLRTQYRQLRLDDDSLLLARRLLFAHPLRAFDALQVASALRVRNFLGEQAGDFRFCTADRAQGTAAGLEGLIVELLI